MNSGSQSQAVCEIGSSILTSILTWLLWVALAAFVLCTCGGVARAAEQSRRDFTKAHNFQVVAVSGA